jgi:hypothetical protein
VRERFRVGFGLATAGVHEERRKAPGLLSSSRLPAQHWRLQETRGDQARARLIPSRKWLGACPVTARQCKAGQWVGCIR